MRPSTVLHLLLDYVLFAAMTLLAQGAIGWWALLVTPPIMALLATIAALGQAEKKK